MYIPSSFRETDQATLHEFIRSYSFAALVTTGSAGMTATHLPLVLDPDVGPHGQLTGHLARANPQARTGPGPCLVIFSGPHAYITPTWYASPGTVPTWNYVAVHATGRLELVEDRAGLLGILRGSVSCFEQSRPEPWVFDEADPAITAMLGAIVGFRITIDRIEGKWKLNQNHPDERRRNVIDALTEQGDENSRAIADLMRTTLRSDPDAETA